MWDRRAKVLSVHDGDSIDIMVDQGWGDDKTFAKPGARLFGVFAPELKDPGGPETHDFVVSWVNSHMGTLTWPFVWWSARMPKADRDQQAIGGRYVGTLTSLDGTENLNLAIMQFVHDNGYGGGTGG